MIRIVKTPPVFQRWFPSILWQVPGNDKTVYLTFDDGPVPTATPWVLSVLRRYDARATFFCVGNNIEKHPDLFREVIADGHCIGNHTFNHLNGWKTGDREYLENIQHCDDIILASGYPGPVKFFRPPHGKLGYSQYLGLRKQYRIVMWDVLTMDYSPGKNPGRVLGKIKDSTESGSIIVFHDSQKSKPGIEKFLEPLMEYLSQRGFSFKSLNEIS